MSRRLLILLSTQWVLLGCGDNVDDAALDDAAPEDAALDASALDDAALNDAALDGSLEGIDATMARDDSGTSATNRPSSSSPSTPSSPTAPTPPERPAPPPPVVCGDTTCAVPGQDLLQQLSDLLFGLGVPGDDLASGLLPMACCTEAEECGLMAMTDGGSTCLTPPPPDLQCPDVDFLGTPVAGCCMPEGICGINTVQFGGGCVEPYDGLLSDLLGVPPQPCFPWWPFDAGTPDAGQQDAAVPDDAGQDAAVPQDAGTPDAAQDAAQDAETPEDAAAEDATPPDDDGGS